MPESVMLKSVETGASVSLDLSSGSHHPTPSPPPIPSTPDCSDKVMQTLYLLDRFGVSDEFYHELTQVHNQLPRSYKVKAARRDLCKDMVMIRFDPPHERAYRPFKEALAEHLSRELDRNPGMDSKKPILVKISGDGARFSSTLSFTLLTMSFPGIATDVLSGAGNHTFAALKGKEDYEILSLAFRPVLEEINLLIAEPFVEVQEKRWQLSFILGSDLKVGHV